MTGLHVAPTHPQPSDWDSSEGFAESFHKTVGVVIVICSSGEPTLRLVRPDSLTVRVTRSPGWVGGTRMTRCLDERAAPSQQIEVARMRPVKPVCPVITSFLTAVGGAC